MQNGEGLITDITFKLMPFTMQVLVMLCHITLTNRTFFTQITAMWTVLTLYAPINVHVKVFLQITLVTVGLITHTTTDWTFFMTQAFMYCQITLIIERLTTHITWVLRLLFVCAPVTAECSTKSKWLVTHFTCVLIPFSMYCLWFKWVFW